ncbi:MAG: hypothetical protein AAF447_21970 [Myxococcota bacterium]
MHRRPLTIYAEPELGAYGYVEKAWLPPDVRLAAFLKALHDSGLPVDRARAPLATDADLEQFHTPEYIARTERLCAAGAGSLDRATSATNARSRELLSAVADAAAPWVTASELASVLDPPDVTLEAFAPFLVSEGTVDYDATRNAVRLTAQGHAFLADPQATLGGPTYARPHIEPAARAICGAVIDATRRIAAGELQRVFVPIAGFHHAFRDQARNICLYNDSALAVATALSLVAGPVAYVDIDIHHGDGVYAGFADHPRVVIGDIHGVPATVVPAGEVRPTEHEGRTGGAQTALTLAIGPGTEDALFLRAFEKVEAFVRAARPAFVIFEAGVDGLASDPMSDQALTSAVFGQITRRVCALADELAGGRLLVLGGGGYGPDATEGWMQVATAMLDGAHAASAG